MQRGQETLYADYNNRFIILFMCEWGKGAIHCILINCVSLHGSKDNNHNISATTTLSNACHSLIFSNNIASQWKHAQQRNSLFY